MDLGHSTSSICESSNCSLKDAAGNKTELGSMNMDEAAKVAIAHSSNLLKKSKGMPVKFLFFLIRLNFF